MRGGCAARPQGDLLCQFPSREGVHRRASPCGRSRAAPKAGELDEASSDSFNIGSLGDITHAKDLVAEIIAARTRKRLTEELSMRTMRRRRMRIIALVVLAILPSLSASAAQKPPPAPRPGERAEKPGEPPEEALPRADKERHLLLAVSFDLPAHQGVSGLAVHRVQGATQKLYWSVFSVHLLSRQLLWRHVCGRSNEPAPAPSPGRPAWRAEAQSWFPPKGALDQSRARGRGHHCRPIRCLV